MRIIADASHRREIPAIGSWEIPAIDSWEILAIGSWEISAIDSCEIPAIGSWEILAIGSWEILAIGSWEIPALHGQSVQLKGIAPSRLPDASLTAQMMQWFPEQLLPPGCLDSVSGAPALTKHWCARTVMLFIVFNCSDVKCPCRYAETPLTPSEFKPAPL
ncbi:hypothetical protein EMCRGX_G014968 [Ephydatia muelleri]